MFKLFVDIWQGIVSIFKGFVVTGRSMFRKPVTIQYPLQKAAMTQRFRGMADLRVEQCISCLQCVRICPTAALDLTSVTNPETKKKALESFCFNAELCCFCGLCQDVCPTKAIFLNALYEVAYYKRSDVTAIDLMAPDKYAHVGVLAAGKGKP